MECKLDSIPEEINGYKILNLMHAAAKAVIFKV